MPKGVYPHTHIKPRVYPPEIVEAVRRMYLDEGMTVAEVQVALLKGYKAQRIIERHIPERRRAIKRDQTGERNHMWLGDKPRYSAAHLRLTAQFGAASTHQCVDCDGSAAHWSYVGGCPDERDGQDSPPYCVHPDHYQPRCGRCHYYYDRRARRPNGQFQSREERAS